MTSNDSLFIFTLQLQSITQSNFIDGVLNDIQRHLEALCTIKEKLQLILP